MLEKVRRELEEQDRHLTDDERTNEVGLFNFAHSYWASASALMAANVSATHPDEPINYLLFHSVELFLKSYLRAKGLTVRGIKRIGHGLQDLAARAEEFGLKLDKFDHEVIDGIGPNYLAARYIRVGFFSRPAQDDLWAICSCLYDNVGDELKRLDRVKRLPDRPPLQCRDEV